MTKREIFSAFKVDHSLATACCFHCKRHLKYDFFTVCSNSRAACCSYCKNKPHTCNELCRMFKKIAAEPRNYKLYVKLCQMRRDVDEKGEVEIKKVEFLMLLEAEYAMQENITRREKFDNSVSVKFKLLIQRAQACFRLHLLQQAKILIEEAKNVSQLIKNSQEVQQNRIVIMHEEIQWLHLSNETIEADKRCFIVWNIVAVLFPNWSFKDFVGLVELSILVYYKLRKFKEIVDLARRIETRIGHQIQPSDVSYRVYFIIYLSFVHFATGVENAVSLLFNVLNAAQTFPQHGKFIIYSEYCEYILNIRSEDVERESNLKILCDLSNMAETYCKNLYGEESIEFADFCAIRAKILAIKATTVFENRETENKDWKKNAMLHFEQAIDCILKCIGIYRHLFGEEHSVFCDHPNYGERIKDCFELFDQYNYITGVINRKATV